MQREGDISSLLFNLRVKSAKYKAVQYFVHSMEIFSQMMNTNVVLVIVLDLSYLTYAATREFLYLGLLAM